MTAINDEMKRLMRQSLSELDASDPKSLAPIRDMTPHHMSLAPDLASNGLVYMFPVDIDGKKLHVYLKQK